MEIGVPTSLIPHDATTPSGPRRYESSGGLADLLALVSLVLFVASGALGAGSFLYDQYVTSQSTSKQASIKAAEKALDPVLIQQLTRVDQRMNSSASLLGVHIAPSAFFAALNQTTLITISFHDLDFKADGGDISIKMSGVARDVNSVALQAEVFSKSGIITDAIFSGIDQRLDGVHFNVVALVNPVALNYTSLVTGQAPAGVNKIPVSLTPTPERTEVVATSSQAVESDTPTSPASPLNPSNPKTPHAKPPTH